MLRFSLFFFSLVVFNCASENLQKAALVGNWQAIELFEVDSLLPLNLEEVQLTFSENGTYLFTGTLKYREAGKYRLSDNLLFFTRYFE
ncbi:MAG: hypothetical protein HC912_09600 [Saprospiraceae bacterium]|nr:hypothetical protein [Saprospiraceae bacterium]